MPPVCFIKVLNLKKIMLSTKEQKQLQLDQLHQLYQFCTACPLGTSGRKQVVFGEGNPAASLMLIGEAPGREEDEQGKPFIGRSGRLLTASLSQAGIQRSEIFITNIVKCRPPNNRAPRPAESSTCQKLLLWHQIAIIQPKIIATIGACALEPFLTPLQTGLKITQLHGQAFESKNILIVPLFHPAYILRNKTKLPDFIKDIEYLKQLLLKV